MLTIYNLIFSFSGYLQLPALLLVPPVSVFHLAPLEIAVLELLLAMFLIFLMDIIVQLKQHYMSTIILEL